MSDLEILKASISTLQDRVRQLKLEKADQNVVAEEVQKLGQLKKQMPSIAGENSKDEGKKGRLTLKTPKGTRDWAPVEMSVREHIFSTLTRVFKAHGGCTIDTPVFELREILAGKYGEDSKLIYDLQDQGGEICSLRYDLTVPFARFLAMNGSLYPTIKRYHIAKVYRRDAPAMTKGRMREFYQCDFDIAGSFDPMIPDAEVICILCEALTALDIGEFTVKINHRKILDGIFEVCGVPPDKIRTISSAVDKLDKTPWEEVRREMTEDKGLNPDVADKIGEFVKLKGGPELLEQLRKTELASNKSAVVGMADMELLFQYLGIYGIVSKISFDLSLARGLDYYTGVIYEAIVEGSAPPSIQPNPAVPPSSSSSASTEKPKAPKKSAPKDGEEEEVDESQIGVGSIAAGGRYDELVGMFVGAASGESSKKKDKQAPSMPCVGVSVGVERVFSILMQRAKEKGAEGTVGRSKETEVYIMSVGDGLLAQRMALAKQLWDAGIKTEFMYKAKPKLQRQFEVVDKEHIPFAVIMGPDELKDGFVKVKEQKGKSEAAGDGEKVDIKELVRWLKERL